MTENDRNSELLDLSQRLIGSFPNKATLVQPRLEKTAVLGNYPTAFEGQTLFPLYNEKEEDEYLAKNVYGWVALAIASVTTVLVFLSLMAFPAGERFKAETFLVIGLTTILLYVASGFLCNICRNIMNYLPTPHKIALGLSITMPVLIFLALVIALVVN